MDVIPKQLENFRFIKLKPDSKEALETGFTDKNNYSLNEIIGEKSCGVLIGKNHVVIDIDNKWIANNLTKANIIPDTLTIRTPGKQGFHFYYESKEARARNLSMAGVGIGEIRTGNQYVLSPNSMIKDKKYEIIKDLPLANITPDELEEKFKRYITWDSHKKLRPCFLKALKDKMQFEDAEGHDFRTALACESLANGLTEDETVALFCYQNDFNNDKPGEKSEDHVKIIFRKKLKPWKCETIGDKCPMFTDCENCILKNKKKDNNEYTLIELPEILNKDDYFKEDNKKVPRFKASLMATAICFNPDGTNRGLRIAQDNKKIYWYNGKYWQDNGEEIIRDIIQQILGDSTCLRYKNEVISWIKDCMELHIDREQLDSGKYKIGLQNGIYDLETQTLMPFSQKHFITALFPINHDVLAKCDKFKKFLSEILEESDIQVIQEMFGYCFLKDYPLAVMFFLVGIGRNGKSTLLNVLIKLLGKENVSNIPIQALADESFSKIRLYHKYANIVSDLSTKELEHTGTLKQITGNDVIQARDLYEKPINFLSYAKVINAMNEIPVCHDETLAWLQRCSCVEFTNQFLDGAEGTDQYLKDKLTTQEELDGVFIWAMDGFKRLQEQKCFSQHKNLTDMLKFIAETKNSILQFVTKHTRYKQGTEILKDDVYKKFIAFCIDKKFKTVSSSHFSGKFKQYMTEQSINYGESTSKILKGRIWKDIEVYDDTVKPPNDGEMTEEERNLEIAAGLDYFKGKTRKEVQNELDNY